MSPSTISTFQLFALFPDEETARLYLQGRIWPSGPVCPSCGAQDRISGLGVCATRKPGFYRCLPCGFDFTVRTNTIMERSKVPLHKWLYSMYPGYRPQKDLQLAARQRDRRNAKDGVVYPRSPP